MKECTFHPKITMFKSKSAMKERRVSIGNILKQKSTFLSRNHHLVYSKSANCAPPKFPLPLLDLKNVDKF